MSTVIICASYLLCVSILSTQIVKLGKQVAELESRLNAESHDQSLLHRQMRQVRNNIEILESDVENIKKDIYIGES